MSTEPDGDAAHVQIRRKVLDEIRGFDERMGKKWSWGGNLKFLFVACGLTKLDVDKDLKDAFQREVHRYVPEHSYSRQLVELHVDQIIGLVRQYHQRVVERAARKTQDMSDS